MNLQQKQRSAAKDLRRFACAWADIKRKPSGCEADNGCSTSFLVAEKRRPESLTFSDDRQRRASPSLQGDRPQDFHVAKSEVREPSIKSVGIPFTQSCSKSAWAYRAEAIKLLVSLMAVAPSRKA